MSKEYDLLNKKLQEDTELLYEMARVGFVKDKQMKRDLYEVYIKTNDPRK